MENKNTNLIWHKLKVKSIVHKLKVNNIVLQIIHKEFDKTNFFIWKKNFNRLFLVINKFDFSIRNACNTEIKIKIWTCDVLLAETNKKGQ